MPGFNNNSILESYLKAYDYYLSSLEGRIEIWDYIFLTASNEVQAEAYRLQIDLRLEQCKMPLKTKYVVLPDPKGKRVGSGGATLNVMRYIKSKHENFSGLKIMVIHSGGDSKRIPHYSACGKIFSSIPRQLPDGRLSTLFDEIIISMSGVPSGLKDGMLVCAGDVLCVFNSQKICFHNEGAAAISIKESVIIGKNHGVFLCDENDNVGQFLHKRSEKNLHKSGAVNKNGDVDIDTGSVILSSCLLEDIFNLINTNKKFNSFVNDYVRLSFYVDILYPLSSQSRLNMYLIEKPEGELSKELNVCRRQIWNKIHKYNMKVMRFSPASYIHFGTTKELLLLVTKRIEEFENLGWASLLNTNIKSGIFAARNSFIHHRASIGKGSYIEDSIIDENSIVGDNCIISGVVLDNSNIANGTVIHGLKLLNGKFVVRMYGVDDNPKDKKWFNKEIESELWTENLFPICKTISEALHSVLNESIDTNVISLMDSYKQADVVESLRWQSRISDSIKVKKFIEHIDDRRNVHETIHIFNHDISDYAYDLLLDEATNQDIHTLDGFGRKIRIYYYLAILKSGDMRELLINKCFEAVKEGVVNNTISGLKHNSSLKIKQDEANIELPVRVNWGGGWSDTPPTCMEYGGTVINAAITVNGSLPVKASIRRIDEMKIVCESVDCDSIQVFHDTIELQNCSKSYDVFSIHKAALICCGIVPVKKSIPLNTILEKLGGGIYLSTDVNDIPKGSGLGTSSILAGACVKVIFEFLGEKISDNMLFNRVLCMEQLMSTGGGWQDQIGGMTRGIKMLTSTKGLRQSINCSYLDLSQTTLQELEKRFCLIYTGKRRFINHLLRDAVGRIIGCDTSRLKLLVEMQRVAIDMRDTLEKGNINEFAKLLSDHWILYQKYDDGCTNAFIDNILNTIGDLIVGKMICGAGGGGFLQVILREGVTKEELNYRLNTTIDDNDVVVWTCSFFI